MTQIKSIYTVVSTVLVILTVILTASMGYSMAYPNTIAQTQVPAYSVNIANKPGIGSYLTNGTGWTLYVFARDIPINGTSRCTGMCTRNWPVFYTASLNLPTGVDANSFTVITRPDGGKQIAFNGWPLYYFRNDTKPGDTNGQGFLKLWSVATYPVLTSTTTATTSFTVSSWTRQGGPGY
jgi:predicted lipoprotein with Yx(FWY)xxD motif